MGVDEFIQDRMPELLRPEQCPEQSLFREEGVDFVMRPIFPKADTLKMAQVLWLCNTHNTEAGANLLSQDPYGDADYIYERATSEGMWGRIITTHPVGLITVGFALGLPLRDTNENIVRGSQDLRLLMVHPMFWKQSHARFLLKWAARHNQQQGAERLLLWVHADNERAQGVYKEAGYVETGETKLREGVPMIQLCLDLTVERPDFYE